MLLCFCSPGFAIFFPAHPWHIIKNNFYLCWLANVMLANSAGEDTTMKTYQEFWTKVFLRYEMSWPWRILSLFFLSQVFVGLSLSLCRQNNNFCQEVNGGVVRTDSHTFFAHLSRLHYIKALVLCDFSLISIPSP